MTEVRAKPLIFVVLDTPAAWFGINGQEKTILTSLCGHLNLKRNGTEVWPSLARLVDLTGFSESTVRRALQKLHAIELIKIRTDSGKSNTYTVNTEVIHSMSDPCHSDRGIEVDPCHTDRGTPVTQTETPVPQTPEQLRTAKLNNRDNYSLGCSTSLKVRDTDKQRKLAVHGIVARAADKITVTEQEQPTVEKSFQAVVLPKAREGP